MSWFQFWVLQKVPGIEQEGSLSKVGRFYPFNYMKGEELARKLWVRKSENFFGVGWSIEGC